MRGVVATTAVLGVLAVGGLPAAALVVAAEEARTPDAAVAQQRTGPPAWANGRARGHDKHRGHDRDKAGKDRTGKDRTGKDKAGKDKAPRAAKSKDDEEREGAKRDRRQGPPPGWGRHHQGRSPHGWAVREWAHCLAGAASEPEEGRQLDPHAACGAKPAPPGHAKR